MPDHGSCFLAKLGTTTLDCMDAKIYAAAMVQIGPQAVVFCEEGYVTMALIEQRLATFSFSVFVVRAAKQRSLT